MSSGESVNSIVSMMTRESSPSSGSSNESTMSVMPSVPNSHHDPRLKRMVSIACAGLLQLDPISS